MTLVFTKFKIPRHPTFVEHHIEKVFGTSLFHVAVVELQFFKVRVSPSKKKSFICFNERPFYFILKALFVQKIFKFLCLIFGHVEKTASLER